MSLENRAVKLPDGAIRVYSEKEIDGFANAIAEHIRAQIGPGDTSDVKLLSVSPEAVLLAPKVFALLRGVLLTVDQYDAVTFRNRQIPDTHAHIIDPRGMDLPPVRDKRVHLLLARERSGSSRELLARAAIASGAASVHTSVMIYQPTNGREGPDFAAVTVDDPDIRLFGFGMPLLESRKLGLESDYAAEPEIYILPRNGKILA